jgi:hypothetical protein
MTTISYQLVNSVRNIIAVYSKNALCGQNAELLNGEVCGSYSYYWVLKG